MIEINDFISLIGHEYTLLSVRAISLAIRIALFFLLIKHTIQSKKTPALTYLLFGILIGSICSSSATFLKKINPDPEVYARFFRVAWAFVIIQYQCLALFLDNLTKKNFSLSWHHKPYIYLSVAICGFLIFFGIFDYPDVSPTVYPYLFLISALYAIHLLIPSIITALTRIRTTEMPRIIKKQLSILIPYVITPWLLSDLLQLYVVFNKHYFSKFTSNAINCTTTVLLTYTLYYCVRKIIVFRFLNMTDHVGSHKENAFVDSFKHVLEQLSRVTSISELNHITQTFFHDTFDVPMTKSKLYIRHLKSVHSPTNTTLSLDFIESTTETFLATHAKEACSLIETRKILIYDEIAFSNFYEKNQQLQEVSLFLETINSDIFLPLYDQTSMIGYIVIERGSRPHQFYTDIERDEMLILSNYLSNVINLIYNKNFEALIKQEKDLKEELYHKEQEISQYKESLRSFLKNSQQKAIGIIFYKNRRFVFGNQIAKELIGININVHEGHPLTKTLKELVRSVREYKTARNLFSQDQHGNKIVLSAVPSIEQNNVIITAYYPEVTDVIKKQIDLLKNPTEWDYLLYLETTQSGKLINQLIPGSGEMLLNFKIHLLKIALSTKALLVEANEEDLIPTVELLHHMSMREQLYILPISEKADQNAIAIELFGINPIFGLSSHKPALLQTLNESGTLFIQNIERLSFEIQEHLAEFIRYGYYRMYKSDTKMPSNVRIICSTSQHAEALIAKGSLCPALLNELQKTSICMPSPAALSEQELYELADAMTEQAVGKNEFKSLLELTEKEKLSLARKRPLSLHELKIKIQQLIAKKSQQNNLSEPASINHELVATSDPLLLEAARLGKHALRDRKLVTSLWHKLQNQSKMATLLGVNRSSINRRCKEYRLQ